MNTEFAPVLNEALQGVISVDDLADLQARNKQRAQAAIKAMGPAWCCSRANSVPRRAPEPTMAEIHSAARMLSISSAWPVIDARF